MRENLAKDYIDSLRFIGETAVNPAAFHEEFDEYREETGGDYPLVFVETYSRSTRKHSVVLLLSLNEQDGECLAQIHFDSDSTMPSPPKSIGTPDDGLERLSSLSEEIDFTLDASFSYDVSNFRPALPIPIKLPNDGETLFDEVLGLRVAKSGEQGERKYSAIIDLLAKKTINVHIRASVICKVAPQAIVAAKDELVLISRRFVTRSSVKSA